MNQLHKIIDKADYISALAFNIILSEKEIGIVDEAKLNEIYMQLCNIADDLDEYHEF